jgi:hypothetical protein
MQKMPRFLPMLALAGPLMACSTAAQQQAVAMHDGIQSAVSQGKACEAQVGNRPEFAALRPHVTHEGNPTAAELADTSLPTAAEAELLKRYTIDHAACESATRDQIVATDPAVAQAVDQYIFDFNSIYADLIMRKITWADAVRRKQEANLRDGPAIRAAHEATMRSLTAQHQQELAERQAAADRLLTGLVSAAAIYQATHPQTVYVHDASTDDGGPSNCQGVVYPGGNFSAHCN